jgi:hypothetical protein
MTTRNKQEKTEQCNTTVKLITWKKCDCEQQGIMWNEAVLAHMMVLPQQLLVL